MQNTLDRMLSSERDVIPTTQFVRTVMVAVHREASLPAPIAFPWCCVMPGLAMGVVGLACLIVVAVLQLHADSVVTSPVFFGFPSVLGVLNRFAVGWISLALVASIVPAKLARS